jgi:hypothetical protein
MKIDKKTVNKEEALLKSIRDEIEDGLEETEEIINDDEVTEDTEEVTEEVTENVEEVIEDVEEEEVAETDNISKEDYELFKEEKKEKEKEVKKEAPKTAKLTHSVLDNITVDLNNIEIVNKTSLDQHENFNFIFSKKSVYQVICCQSCYSSEFSALTLADLNSIASSNQVDLYTNRNNLYRILHSHLENTSVGKMGYKDWLKITSFQDLDTVFYGIFCQTFPDSNNFDITCGSCEKKTSLNVNNVSLVEVKDEKVYDRIDEVISSVKSTEELSKKSLVSITERLLLKNSKIIFEIKIPSLWDHLELLHNIDRKVAEQYADTIGTYLFVNKVLLPDIKIIKATGKAAYYPLTEKESILELLKRLDIDDGKQLTTAIEERAKKYGINYMIKNAKCQHCSDSLGEIPIDMEQALFTLIRRVREA